MMDKNTALVPEEGWHCLHLFYRIEYGQWQLLSREEQNAAKTNLASLVQEIRAMESTQLLTLSMVTPKADIAFMLITPDLHSANRIEKQLSLSLGADVLTSVYSYLSLTEESEYITTEKEYAETLVKEQNIKPDSDKLAEAMNAFQSRASLYQMLLDPGSGEYAVFGEFYTAIQFPLDDLFPRLHLGPPILWMGDRAVYCARLESVCAERHPGFESPPIRHTLCL